MNGGPKGGGGPLLAWSCIMVALGTMLTIWSEGSTTALLFLGGPIPLVFVAAWNRARPAPGGPRPAGPGQPAGGGDRVGGSLAAIGLTGGLWLTLIGGEIALFGLVWLGREVALERRGVGR